MMHSARRQILTDMGLTLWRLRVAAEEVGAVQRPPVPSAARPDAGRARPEAAAADTAADPGSAPPSGQSASGARGRETAPTAVPGEAVTATRGPETVPTPAAETPWMVVSLAVGDVVMLVEGSLGRRDQRLAQDVLAAAAGQWRARPVRRPFRWPPELGDGASLAAAPDAGARALRAFVDKDLADHQATLLLCTEAVHQRLTGDWPDGRLLVVPDLARLGADPEAKRTLWGTLSARAQEAAR